MNGKRLRKARQSFEVLPGQGKRFSFSNFKQALIFYLLLLLALVILVQLGYHWLGEQFQAWRLKIVEAEQGYMRQQVAVKGIVTRAETVVLSPVDGVILELAAAGGRVPAGTELAKIGQLTASDMEMLKDSEAEETVRELWGRIQQYWQGLFPAEDGLPHDNLADNQSVFVNVVTIESSEPGFISYYLDSWESFDGPLYLTAEELEQQTPAGTYTAKGDLVESGQPLLKIVNNWQWRYSLVLPLHPGRIIATKNSVELIFEFASAEPLKAELTAYEVDEAAQEVRLTYLIDRQLPGFDLVRAAAAILLYEQKSGIIIPEEALASNEGVAGIFLNRGGRVVFVPVTVIEKQEGRVMVEGVAPNSLVITRPELVTEGQRLN